nr:hypothetical protein [Tanacetum cinerariifolium]
MHKVFPLPVMEFPLPGEVPTASEDSSHCQKKGDATAEKIALLLKSSSNCIAASAPPLTDAFAADKTGLGYNSQLNERDLNNKSDVFESAFDSSVNISEEDNNQAMIVITNSGKVPVNTVKQSSPRAAASTSTTRYVNTTVVRPIVNGAKLSSNVFHKSHSPVRRTFN